MMDLSPPASTAMGLLRRRWVLGGSVVLLLLALLSPVSYAGSDSHFALVVAQALGQRGTLALEGYRVQVPEQFEAFGYQIVEAGGHLYYAYPLGSSLLALPVVLAATGAGLDMLNPAHNYLVQNALSALICALVFVMSLGIARCYLPRRESVLLVGVMVLGSSLVSTLGTAFWNQGAAVLLLLASLALVVRYDTGRARSLHPYPLAGLLAMAFLCRPTVALLALLVGGYALMKARGEGLRLAGALFLFGIAFLLFSLAQYGTLVPPYYRAAKWVVATEPGVALAGLLVSPSRGLLVYSPFLLLVLAGALWLLLKQPRQWLVWGCLVWVGGHLMVVASTALWWGGFSFGPRLLTDILPAFLLLGALAWREGRERLGTPMRRAVVGGYLTLGAFAIWVHSVQGLWNVNTVLWNAMPSVDNHPEYLFDWDAPQFLATAETLHARHAAHVSGELERGERTLAPYTLGTALAPPPPESQALFFGWWPSRSGQWWSEVEQPTLLFGPLPAPSESSHTLTLTLTSLRAQPLDIALNGAALGHWELAAGVQTLTVPVTGTLLHTTGVNELALSLPATDPPPLAQARTLGLSAYLHELGVALEEVRVE